MTLVVKDYGDPAKTAVAEEGREALEEKFGQVWNTKELGEDFTVSGFMAPLVVVTRKSDGVEGSLEFTHNPRYYFNFR